MLVELLGLPGSGKSTLIRALVPRLRAQNVSVRRAEKLAGLPCHDRHAPRYVQRGADRTALYRATQFRRQHRGLMKHVEHKLALSPSDEFLFTLTTALYQACREYTGTFGIALLDEGFVHRGVSAHLECEDAAFQRYMEMIPVPDLAIHLCPPVQTAFERAVSRRAHKGEAHKVTSKLGDRDMFERRDALLRIGARHIHERGTAVIEVDTRDSLDACLTALLPVLASATRLPTAAE